MVRAMSYEVVLCRSKGLQGCRGCRGCMLQGLHGLHVACLPIVQKGKFAACAVSEPMSALKRVLLPTLGRPTMPQLSFMDRVVWRLARAGTRLILPVLSELIMKDAALDTTARMRRQRSIAGVDSIETESLRMGASEQSNEQPSLRSLGFVCFVERSCPCTNKMIPRGTFSTYYVRYF
jgi:hypothetical protein